MNRRCLFRCSWGGFLPFVGESRLVSFWLSNGGYSRFATTPTFPFSHYHQWGQCISCGNCSAYCEMGIDVRAYAQKGQNIVRSSCVGCGICSAVCPRGVLKLENGAVEGRTNEPNFRSEICAKLYLRLK